MCRVWNVASQPEVHGWDVSCGGGGRVVDGKGLDVRARVLFFHIHKPGWFRFFTLRKSEIDHAKENKQENNSCQAKSKHPETGHECPWHADLMERMDGK